MTWDGDLRFVMSGPTGTVTSAPTAHALMVGAGPHHVARAAREAAGSAVCGAIPFAGTSAAVLWSDHVRAGEVECARSLAPVQDCDYRDVVRAGLDSIERGGLQKVVLARAVDVDGGPYTPHEVAKRLREQDPSAVTFVARTARGWIVGATPEVLVSRRGRTVESFPLAGSARRCDAAAEDAASAARLASSEKDRREHAFTASAVVEALRPFCEHVEADETPRLHATATMWHLGTRVRGTLRDPAPSSLELAAALHPTPAVCGVPTGAALRAIAEIEGFDRGCYTGLAGWQDASGDGEWVLALRCAELNGRTARLYAGNGIVAGSDPDDELAETEAKLATMRRALGLRA